MDRLLITVDQVTGRTHVTFAPDAVALSVRVTEDVVVELGGDGEAVGIELGCADAVIPWDRLRDEFALPEHAIHVLVRWFAEQRDAPSLAQRGQRSDGLHGEGDGARRDSRDGVQSDRDQE